MWTPSDRFCRAGRRAARVCRRGPALIAFALILVLPAAQLAAQPAAPRSASQFSAATATASSAGGHRELRQTIEGPYQVSTGHNGGLLRPRVEPPRGPPPPRNRPPHPHTHPPR